MIEISNAELDVMQAIWQQHPASARDIILRLQSEKEWHEKTVKTLLGRMVKKGAIGYEKQGREFIYRPLIERDEYSLKEGKNLLSRLFSGRIAPLVNGFAKTGELSQQDIDELKKVIADWENKQ